MSSLRLVIAFILLLPLAAMAQPKGAKSYVFHGRIVAVNAQEGTLSVANENIAGWMSAMTMGYRPDKPEALKGLKAGDTITATVYDGDFATLYGITLDKAGSGDEELPPISYACPTAGETAYVDDKPGKCPKSGETLQAVRLTIAYSCLKVQIPLRERPGVCPVDRSELVPVTAGLYFTCQKDPSVREMNPGTCADGSPRTKAFERRPHGDHNPRHGGGFVFMSADEYHHVEGTFVAPNIFRVYFYNDMARPTSAAALVGRVSLVDEKGTELGAPIPLALGKAADHSTLEAVIPNAKLPLSLKLYMRFKPNSREQVFDFRYTEFSKEP